MIVTVGTSGARLEPVVYQGPVVTGSGRPSRLYRLIIEKPAGSDQPGWRPAGWDDNGPFVDPDSGVFRWPVARTFLTRAAAENKANKFRAYGAKVTIQESNPVTWPEGP